MVQTDLELPAFVLASASPARLRLLRNIGMEPTVCPSDFDEAQISLTDPQALVEALAQGKAKAVAPQFPDALVLGCDSVLALEGEIYGKPDDAEMAIARWKTMRGKVGKLYTGHFLLDTRQGRSVMGCGITEVHFAKASDRQIAAYVATGEPLKCAGCFALEGRGGVFIEKLVGCHTNVIGLSLPLLRSLIEQLGYDLIDFWG